MVRAVLALPVDELLGSIRYATPKNQSSQHTRHFIHF